MKTLFLTIVFAFSVVSSMKKNCDTKVKEIQFYKFLRYAPKGPGKLYFALQPKYVEKVKLALKVNKEVIAYGGKVFGGTNYDNTRDAFENALFSYLCIQKNNYNVPECQMATDAYQRDASYKPGSRVMDLLNDKIGRALGLRSKPSTTLEEAAEDVMKELKKGRLYTRPIDFCQSE